MRQWTRRERRAWHEDPTRVALVALATHRLTRAVTTDTMPWLEIARDRAERALPEQWAAGLRCPHCASVYLAPLVVAVAELAERTGRGHLWWPVAAALAASSATGMIAEREPA